MSDVLLELAGLEEELAGREDREEAAAADEHVEHDLGIGSRTRGLSD